MVYPELKVADQSITFFSIYLFPLQMFTKLGPGQAQVRISELDQGLTQTLDSSVLPPRVRIRRKLEGEAELGLESRHFTWEVDVPHRISTVALNSCH